MSYYIYILCISIFNYFARFLHAGPHQDQVLSNLLRNFLFIRVQFF